MVGPTPGCAQAMWSAPRPECVAWLLHVACCCGAKSIRTRSAAADPTGSDGGTHHGERRGRHRADQSDGDRCTACRGEERSARCCAAKPGAAPHQYDGMKSTSPGCRVTFCQNESRTKTTRVHRVAMPVRLRLRSSTQSEYRAARHLSARPACTGRICTECARNRVLSILTSGTGE